MILNFVAAICRRKLGLALQHCPWLASINLLGCFLQFFTFITNQVSNSDLYMFMHRHMQQLNLQMHASGGSEEMLALWNAPL